MKISYRNVLDVNKPFLKFYIEDVDPIDDLTVLKDKVRASINVDPNDTDASSIVVRFAAPALVAVADETPDSKILVKALRKIGVSAAALASGGTASLVVNGVTVVGDVADIAKELFITGVEPQSFQYVIPVDATKSACSYSVTCRIVGASVTSDVDDATTEKANVETDLRVRRQFTQKQEQKNEATADARQIDHKHALDKVAGVDGRLDVAATVQTITKTDGDFWHDTISAVKIDIVEFVIEEKCLPQDEEKTPSSQSSGASETKKRLKSSEEKQE